MSEKTTLEELEKAIVLGRQAVAMRDDMILTMMADGESPTEIQKRINDVHLQLGAKPITREAVIMVKTRVRNRKSD